MEENKLTICCNGKKIYVAPGTHLEGWLIEAGYRLVSVAVEVNGQIVSPTAYGTTELVEGMKIEVVSFVGGG